MSSSSEERWKTVRGAVNGGWGATFRYVFIIVVPTVVTAALLIAVARLH